MFALTKRLTLRPGWPEDAPALARAIGQRAVAANLSGVPWPYTLGDAEAFLAKPRGGRDVVLLICSREADGHPLVGGIGLRAAAPGEAPMLGYWLVPEAWGRGYMTEAARAVIDIARDALGLRRVRARHFVDNAASARVLAKLGFRPTGETVRLPCPARDEDVEARMLAVDLAPRRAAPLSIAA